MSAPTSAKSTASRPFFIAGGFVVAVIALALIVSGAVAGFGMWVLFLAGLFVGTNALVRLILARTRR